MTGCEVCVVDWVVDCIQLGVSQATGWQHIGNQTIQKRLGKCTESGSVQPVFLNQADAIDYATDRFAFAQARFAFGFNWLGSQASFRLAKEIEDCDSVI